MEAWRTTSQSKLCTSEWDESLLSGCMVAPCEVYASAPCSGRHTLCRIVNHGVGDALCVRAGERMQCGESSTEKEDTDSVRFS